MEKENKINSNLEDILRLSKKIDNTLSGNSCNDILVAIYLLIRYGMIEIENYIDSADLEQIQEEILNCDNIFNEDLNDKIDLILSCKEEEEEE